MTCPEHTPDELLSSSHLFSYTLKENPKLVSLGAARLACPAAVSPVSIPFCTRLRFAVSPLALFPFQMKSKYWCCFRLTGGSPESVIDARWLGA